MYVNKIENRITFKIKTEYYLELVTSETIKFLGSTKSKITKNKSCEDVPHLETTEVVLIYCKIVNNDYWQDSGVLCTFVINTFIWSIITYFTQEIYIFKNFILEFSLVIKILNR